MINSLTSLRFFAAFLVFVHHYMWLDTELVNWPFQDFFSALIANGFLGVSFFYVLSGFVLSYAYERKFANSQISNTQFYLARFARIYPLHLITLLVAMPLMLNSHWAGSFFTALPFGLTLTQSFVPVTDFYYSFNSPSWSISNEAFFYALFPFLIGRSTRQLLAISCAILALIAIGWLAQSFYNPLKDLWHWMFYINPFFRLFEFVLGIVVFNVARQGLINLKNVNVTFATIYELIALGLIALLVIFYDHIPAFLSKGTIFGPVFAIMVFVFYFEAGLLSRLLSNRVFVYLGDISFGLYMWHQVVFRYLSDYSLDGYLVNNPTTGLLLVILLVLLLSSLSFHFIELPLNKFIKDRTKRP